MTSPTVERVAESAAELVEQVEEQLAAAEIGDSMGLLTDEPPVEGTPEQVAEHELRCLETNAAVALAAITLTARGIRVAITPAPEGWTMFRAEEEA